MEAIDPEAFDPRCRLPPYRRLLRLLRRRDSTPLKLREPMSYPNTPWYSRPGRIRGYTAHVGDPDNETKHPHPIWFRKDTFTLDGKTWRKATDPENQDFIKSLEDYKVPAEFKEPGSHEFLVVSAEKLEFPFPVNLHPPKREPIKIDPREFKPYKRGRRALLLA
ncbi:hypothetical protein ACHQM5_024473 [Ranunculus cassubicifolius]